VFNYRKTPNKRPRRLLEVLRYAYLSSSGARSAVNQGVIMMI